MLLLRVSPVFLWLDKMPAQKAAVSGKWFKRSYGFAVGARIGRLAFTMDVNSVPRTTYTATTVSQLVGIDRAQPNNMDWAGPIVYPVPQEQKVCTPKGCTPRGLSPHATTFYSEVATLTQELKDAKEAHAEYEKRMGTPDENWPEWYARYILAWRASKLNPKRKCPDVGYCS